MEDIVQAVKAQRDFFDSGQTLDIDFRRNALKKLQAALFDYQDMLFEAFWKDLHKAKVEAYGTEIALVAKEIKLHLKKVKRWAKPKRVSTDLLNFYSTSRIHRQPYGVILIISPWNYPLQSALMPLVGALSAGNCAVLKPAHYSKNVSVLIEELIRNTFPAEHVCVFRGNRDVNQALLEQRFDLIFLTGSPALGKVVMEKASKHLTPVVLELGGKSPCIVDRDANLDVASQRIAFGKFLNAGQTCVAPDHLFVHLEVKDRLLEKIGACIRRFYGPDPFLSPDFGRIVNEQQFDRLERLLHSGGTIAHGGRTDRDSRYIEPTLIDQITDEDPIMQEEIFGPLLPVLEFRRLEDVVTAVNGREKPLALYFFSTSKPKCDWLLSATTSGGGCINDTIMHITNPHLPFGGVGNSGMGCYHGRHSFDTFSHHRSILDKTTRFNPTLAYPPYKNKFTLIKRLLF